MSAFNEEDTKRLLELYEENRAVLRGTDRRPDIEKLRHKCWINITETLNVESGKAFAVKAVKKRWQNVKSDAKKAHIKVNKMRKPTGGRPPEGPNKSLRDSAGGYTLYQWRFLQLLSPVIATTLNYQCLLTNCH